MTVAEVFRNVAALFTQLQMITGLSPLSLIIFLLAMWKSTKSAWNNNETMAGVIAQTLFFMLIWWLVGYLILNPIWNIILGRI